MTKTLCTNERLWVAVLTLALVLVSLLLSQDPAAAQEAAAMKQYEEETSSPSSSPSATASPAKPGTETNTTTTPSDAQNESGGGEAFDPTQEAPRPSAPGNSEGGEGPSANNNAAPPSGSKGVQVPSANTPSPGDPDAGADPEAYVPSILPPLFQGESGTGNTTAPSAPQAAVEGLRNSLKELGGALEELMATMMRVFPFAGEQPAKPETETNTTTTPTDTQNTPVQQNPAPSNAPGSEVREDPSTTSVPPSDPNDGQVPSGNTSSPSDPNGQEQPKGCGDASVLTPEEARKCVFDVGGMGIGSWGGQWLK